MTFLSKGNTCYINSTFQCLSTMVQFWWRFNTILKALSHFVFSFVKIMSLKIILIYYLKSSKSTIYFLNFWEKYGEILACILDELCDNLMPWTWCKSRSVLLMTVCLATRSFTMKIFHLSTSCSKHTAALFRFVLNTRTSIWKQFFFSVIIVHHCNQPLFSIVSQEQTILYNSIKTI